MKRALALVLAVILIASFTGCSAMREILSGSKSDAITATDGFASGRIGDTLRNDFFEYTVVSAQRVQEYAGYKAAQGKELIDVVLKIKNVFGERLNMYSSDFQMQWGSSGEEDYSYPIEKIDDTMIPDEFYMPTASTEEYHAVYEVPEGTTDYSISYMEYYSDNTTGDTFFVYFELE